MPVYVAVPASMLSPAPTEKYSSDSDSCHNENVHSPITCDPELECEDVIDPNCELKYDPMQPQPDGECRLLWEFIYQLLEDSKYQHIVSWDRESEHELTFLIKNPTDLATFWGRQKNRNNMTYEKLSRALRYYYKMQIIRKVPGKRLTYEFLIHPSKIRKGQRGAKPHSQRLLSVSADSIPPPTPTTLSSSHISSSPLPSSPSSSSPSTQNLSFSQSAPRALPPQHATDIHSLTSNHRQHMLGCDDEMLYKNSNRDGEIHVFKHSPEIDPYMPVNRSSNSDFLNFPTRNSVWADDAAAAMAGTLVSTSTFHNHEPHLEAESQMFKQEPLSLRHSDGLSVRPMFDVPASRPSEEPKVSPHDNHFRYPPSEPYEVGAAVSRHLDCQMVDQRYLNQGSSSAAYSSQFSSSTRSVPSFPQLPQPSYMELSPSTSSVNSLKARSLTPPCNQGQLDCTKRYRPYPMHSPRYSVSPHGLMENNFCPPAHTHPPAHSSQLPQHFRHTQKHEEQREGARHSTPPNPDVLRYHIHQQLSPPTDKTQQASTLPVTTAKDRLPKFKMEPFVGEQDEPEDLSMKPSSTKDEGATERVALSSTLKGAGCKKDFPRSPEQASAVSPDSSQMDFKDGITNIKSSPKLMKAEYQDEVHSAFSSS
ncbi:ETS domain-containing transcription factor ERF [Aplysia californica]|uniref:ETS domain-containing transcription factor ERF n=1 Tax=Aplysia californica TaxID=6500 RepID=A0ABM0ZXM7_APLCA|nr:ETS domain-containing transcription factor ERF [Aplysia californica]